jgi:hypothetical protein
VEGCSYCCNEPSDFINAGICSSGCKTGGLSSSAQLHRFSYCNYYYYFITVIVIIIIIIIIVMFFPAASYCFGSLNINIPKNSQQNLHYE